MSGCVALFVVSSMKVQAESGQVKAGFCLHYLTAEEYFFVTIPHLTAAAGETTLPIETGP